jgi:ER membrane protein complex subunit 2
MGELNYIMANAPSSEGGQDGLRHLIEAMQRFCRSIELCDDYLRGYYGLKMVRNHP